MLCLGGGAGDLPLIAKCNALLLLGPGFSKRSSEGVAGDSGTVTGGGAMEVVAPFARGFGEDEGGGVSINFFRVDAAPLIN